jgi:hypothetical protein
MARFLLTPFMAVYERSKTMKNMTRVMIIAAAVAALLGTSVIAGEQDRRGSQTRKREESQERSRDDSSRREAEEKSRQEDTRRRQAEERDRQDRSRRETEERDRAERNRRESQERSNREAEERSRQERSRRETEERGRQEESRRRDAENRAQAERYRQEQERRESVERSRQEESRRRDAEARVQAERSRQENERRQALERSRQDESRRRDIEERNRQEESRRAAERSRDAGRTSTPYIRPEIQSGPDRQSGGSDDERASRSRGIGSQDRSGSSRSAQPRVTNPQTQDPSSRVRSRDAGSLNRGSGQRSGETIIRGRDGSTAPLYSNRRIARQREGSFNPGSNDRARSDREFAGKIGMRYGGGDSPRMAKEKGGNIRFYYANPDYSRSGWKLVERDHFGQHRINRHWLIHNNGRWGHCSDQYRGRNYHFYITLVNNNYFFGLGYSTWERRYYGDGWDFDFGWNSGYYIPASYRQHGAWYFEPNYAFSFTFNHGYEQGYIDGYEQGVQDWNRYASYYSYHSGVRGWFDELGPYYEYADGYEQGFRQGYYAGYGGLEFGWDNFGFGDFSQYPVIYDFDYDYFDQDASWNSGYEYTDRW